VIFFGIIISTSFIKKIERSTNYFFLYQRPTRHRTITNSNPLIGNGILNGCDALVKSVISVVGSGVATTGAGGAGAGAGGAGAGTYPTIAKLENVLV